LELIEMRTPRVYLETTMFNYYFEPEREAHADTVKLFEEIRAGKYQAFTSVYALRELRDAPPEKMKKMLTLVDEYGLTTLDFSTEAEQLANIYVREGIIPAKYGTDSVHIAVATVNDLDRVVSLNFKHIVRKKTIEFTELINIREGYHKIGIYTPMEVVDRESE
jgi:predicted nucleic acid-binding protein